MLRTYDVKMIDVSDWDKFIKKIYNKPYCFQQQAGCRDRGIEEFSVPMYEDDMTDFENDTILIETNGVEMGVSFKAWLARDANDKFFERVWENEMFWERNFYPSLSMITNDLYNKGLLEKGEYVINIDW